MIVKSSTELVPVKFLVVTDEEGTEEYHKKNQKDYDIDMVFSIETVKTDLLNTFKDKDERCFVGSFIQALSDTKEKKIDAATFKGLIKNNGENISLNCSELIECLFEHSKSMIMYEGFVPFYIESIPKLFEGESYIIYFFE